MEKRIGFTGTNRETVYVIDYIIWTNMSVCFVSSEENT